MREKKIENITCAPPGLLCLQLCGGGVIPSGAGAGFCHMLQSPDCERVKTPGPSPCQRRRLLTALGSRDNSGGWKALPWGTVRDRLCRWHEVAESWKCTSEDILPEISTGTARTHSWHLAQQGRTWRLLTQSRFLRKKALKRGRRFQNDKCSGV